MKKLALLSAVALGLAFTACDDNDIIDIPVNQEPVIFQTDNLQISAAAQTQSVLDLKTLNDNAENITVADIALTNFPADYELNVVMQISADENFSRIAEVPVTVANNTVTVSPDDLQGVYQSNISKSPKQRTIWARYAAYAVKDQASVRIGDPDYFYGPFQLQVLPIPSSFVIEQNYYLLGTVNGWSVAQAIKLNHSDKDVYDDPVFSIKVDISAADAASGWWWKIVPESTYATGNWVDADNAAFGVAENGDEALSGMLVGRTAAEDCGAGCLKVQGPYLLTINLEEGTYKFEMAIDNLYTPGDSNNWSQAASQLLFTKDYANYYGYANLNSIFKFTSAPNWGGINYGNAGEGVLSTDGGAGNLTVAEPGLYWLHVNLAALTYEATLVKTIGLIGDATPNGWDASTALTPSADNLVWTGEVTFGAGEFKFRANNEWTINLGGSMDDLQQDGGNLASPGAGTYAVTLDLSKLPYTCTMVKK